MKSINNVIEFPRTLLKLAFGSICVDQQSNLHLFNYAVVETEDRWCSY